MDPVTLSLECLSKGMDIFKIILEDIPKENRAQAWKDWYEFWHSVYAGLASIGK